MKPFSNFKKYVLLACVAGLLAACRSQLPVAGLTRQQKAPLEKMLNMVPKDSARQSVVIVYNGFEHGDTTGTRDFAAIVYDKASARRYFFINEEQQRYNIRLVDKAKQHIGLDNLLNYYLAGKTGLLQPLTDSTAVGKGALLPRIYDIDRAKRTAQVFELPGVTL